MKRQLRSNFSRDSYLWAVRNAQWHALGIPESDCDKPKIAVVNSSSELAACYGHLDGVAAQVKAAIRAAGGVPFEVRTTAPSDFVTGAGGRGGYILSARDEGHGGSFVQQGDCGGHLPRRYTELGRNTLHDLGLRSRRYSNTHAFAFSPPSALARSANISESSPVISANSISNCSFLS